MIFAVRGMGRPGAGALGVPDDPGDGVFSLSSKASDAHAQHFDFRDALMRPSSFVSYYAPARKATWMPTAPCAPPVVTRELYWLPSCFGKGQAQRVRRFTWSFITRLLLRPAPVSAYGMHCNARNATADASVTATPGC